MQNVLTEKFSSLKKTLRKRFLGSRKNSRNQESLSTKKESETFVSPTKTPITKRFKYLWFAERRNSVNETVAYIKNHPNYIEYRNYAIDFVWTGLVMSWIVYATPQRNPILRGFGIAVIIISMQSYAKWLVKLVRKRN